MQVGPIVIVLKGSEHKGTWARQVVPLKYHVLCQRKGWNCDMPNPDIRVASILSQPSLWKLP